VLLDTSEDEGRAFLASFELAPPPLPADPYSPEYRDAQWDLYRRVSGLDDYALANEHTPIDLDKFLAQPFPYCTGSPIVVGDQLIAYGYIIKMLNLTPPARVVEFGAGWGHVTMALATMGVDVTVVEIGADFVEYLERQTAHLPNVEIVQGDMLTFSPNEPYDAALFFESFHHCSDHLEMLRRLHDIVKPSGQVMFAAEPIDHFPFPWGLRLDGMSLWSTRRYGWLELGFDSAYFVEALARQGWLSHAHRVRAASPLAYVVVARPDTSAVPA
jgi:SAM-dependent methyltransferase